MIKLFLSFTSTQSRNSIMNLIYPLGFVPFWQIISLELRCRKTCMFTHALIHTNCTDTQIHVHVILVPEASGRARRLRHWRPFLQPEIGGPMQPHVEQYMEHCRGRRILAVKWQPMPTPSSPKSSSPSGDIRYQNDVRVSRTANIVV
jgi:hypothetical protein